MPDLRQPVKWHGGKNYLAKDIIALMPPRCQNPNAPAADDPGWCHYVEPFFGGGAVLLALAPEGIGEVANDLNGRLTNFWRCLACPASFAEFERRVQALPCCEAFFEQAQERLATPCEAPGIICINCALAFFVVNRQSRQALGKDFATLARTRTRRGMNELPAAWLSAVEGLPAVHARLKRVVVLNRDALDVIRQQDGPRTLFYLDPPYVHETRTVPDAYQHEMTYAQHRELLELLKAIKGRFLLSGYDSDLYRGYANTVPRWTRHDFDIANHAGGGEEKRRMVESVWCNF